MRFSLRKIALSAQAFSLIVLFAACSVAQKQAIETSPGTSSSVRAQEQKPLNPVTWSATAEADKKIVPGKSFAILLKAQIEKGWHLYSTEEIAEGPRPTRISLAPDQPFESKGEIESPEPKSAHDENFNTTTQFYETEVTFRVPVQMLTTAPPGHNKVALQVRYQVCNDHLCLPPKTVKLEVPFEKAKS
jgi:thiol:disulfide interchange protein DsbD